MGCEASNLLQNNQSIASSDIECEASIMKLSYDQFIQKSKSDDIGKVYHFQQTLSNEHNLVQRVIDRSSKITRVCKSIRIDRTDKTSCLHSLRELSVLLKLSRQPNIAQIIQYYIKKNTLCIIMEEIDGKNLMEYDISAEKYDFTIIREIIRQILIALKYCHQEHGIAHTSINDRNVMLKIKENKEIVVKVVGWGKAMIIGGPCQKFSICLTGKGEDGVLYIPPEKERQTFFPEKNDVYACGILFLVLLSGQRKFQDFPRNKPKIIKRIIDSLTIQLDLKVQLTDLISKLLQFNPQKRITAGSALTHKLFNIQSVENQKEIRQKLQNVMLRLMNFKIDSHLKTLFSVYASLRIFSPNQKTERLKEFYQLDKDKNGRLDFNELLSAIKLCFNMQESAARQYVSHIFQMADKDDSQEIDYFEYVMATSSFDESLLKIMLKRMFNEFDTNLDGILTQEDLNHAIDGLDSKSVFKGKKELNFMEFKDLMLQVFQKKPAEP